MTAAPTPSPPDRLAELVELWRRACSDLVALARSLPPEKWDLPTDLAGWTVKDNVAHTAHLEAVLAGAPEETIPVGEAPHLTGPMSHYTEQGILARRDQDMEALAQEIEHAVETRLAELRQDPPTDPAGAPPRTPGGAPWDNQTLLSNRPFDVWMHEQDVRRAVDLPGGFDSPVAAHALAVLARALPMVVGKRLAPPPGTVVRLGLCDVDLTWAVEVAKDGRATPATTSSIPTVAITLSAEDFVVLGGGRRGAERTSAKIEGDQVLGRRLLSILSVTP